MLSHGSTIFSIEKITSKFFKNRSEKVVREYNRRFCEQIDKLGEFQTSINIYAFIYIFFQLSFLNPTKSFFQIRY